MDNDDQTRPSAKTRDAERREAGRPHEADVDQPETVEPEGTLDPKVIEHEKEMAERGAHQHGEGRIG